MNIQWLCLFRLVSSTYKLFAIFWKFDISKEKKLTWSNDWATLSPDFIIRFHQETKKKNQKMALKKFLQTLSYSPDQSWILWKTHIHGNFLMNIHRGCKYVFSLVHHSVHNYFSLFCESLVKLVHLQHRGSNLRLLFAVVVAEGEANDQDRSLFIPQKLLLFIGLLVYCLFYFFIFVLFIVFIFMFICLFFIDVL